MVEAERLAAVVFGSCAAGVAVAPEAALSPPNKPLEAGAVVAAALVVAGAVVVVVEVAGAVVDAGFPNSVLVAAGAAELVDAAVVAGFWPNNPEAADVEVAGAVVVAAAPPKRLGVAAAEEAAGAAVEEAAGADVVAPAALPNNPFAPVAGAAVAGALVPVAAVEV